MITKTLNFNLINDRIFNILVYIFKPLVRSIYRIYRILKSRNITAKKHLYHEILQKLSFIGMVCILTVLIAFCAGHFTQKINAQDDNILHKYYTSITVQPGESLWSIAEAHYSLGYESPTDYIDEVMQINHITDADELISGTSIVIPYYSEEIK